MTTNELKSICSNISGSPFDYFQKGYETLLKELKDKGIIKEWYFNGEYHFTPYSLEKMKCCGNCKHNVIGNFAELYCQECCYYGVPNQNINKWELAE